MKKFRVISWILHFLLFSFILEDDGLGGDEYLDRELEDFEEESESEKSEEEAKEDTKKQPPDKKEENTTLGDEDKKTLEELKEYADKQRQKEELREYEEELKAKHGQDFSMKKIVDFCTKLNEKNPGSGDAVFNRAGIEALWLAHFAKKGSDNEFDGSGRGAPALTNEQLIEKINSGEASDEEAYKIYAQYA